MKALLTQIAALSVSLLLLCGNGYAQTVADESDKLIYEKYVHPSTKDLVTFVGLSRVVAPDQKVLVYSALEKESPYGMFAGVSYSFSVFEYEKKWRLYTEVSRRFKAGSADEPVQITGGRGLELSGDVVSVSLEKIYGKAGNAVEQVLELVVTYEDGSTDVFRSWYGRAESEIPIKADLKTLGFDVSELRIK